MELSAAILLRLVRAGLGCEDTGGPGAAGSWPEVYALAVRQGVLAVAWDGLRLLEQGGFEGPDRRLRLRWAYNVQAMEELYARQQRAVGRLARFLSGQDIPVMLLKGCGLALDYPVPEHRPCGDIDIYLYGAWRRADEILQRVSGIKIDRDKHHHTVFTLDGIAVENHYDIFNVRAHRSNAEIDRILKSMADTDTRVMIGEGTVCLPSADFNALFLLRHAGAHFSAAEIGLRHIVDWAMFVRRHHGEIDWPRIEDIARRHNMDRFLHCLNALSIDILGVGESCFPPFERDGSLEQRVLAEVLHPAFAERIPKRGFLQIMVFKLRRWWSGRWKHRIVYREGLVAMFFSQLRSHLESPEAMKD